VHIETGKTVGFLRFEAGVQEIFAVQVLRGMRFPEMLEWNDPRLAHSYVLPDEAMAEVALPTEEQLAKSPAYHYQRGNELYKTGKLEEAIAAYRQCLELQPEDTNARFNLAVALGDTGDYTEAGACLEGVIQAEPERAEAYNSIGYVLNRQHRPERAVAYLEKAVQLQPNYAQARFNLGMTLLQLGDYARGFAEYEWRRPAAEIAALRLSHPRWDGRPIPERRLLVHTEQGMGDAIQFARYLPMAGARCGRLILMCRADLMPVFSTIPGISELRRPGQVHVNEYDAHVSLLSLPHLFGTTLDSVPSESPYVDGAAIRRRKANASLDLPPSSDRKVGIAWAGSPLHPHDRERSCPLEEFLPLLRAPGIAFFSLQKGKRREDLFRLPQEIRVEDLESRLGDFGDLAVIISQLDLVIGVDTAVIHLAGALGRPVWTLLSYVPDWRWMLDGETTPWYPTMRLFRQAGAGDWRGVMERASAALAAWERPQTRNVRFESQKSQLTKELL
jgi:hypothetical protein